MILLLLILCAEAGFWGDLKEQVLVIIHDQIDELERQYDINAIVEDPFTLNAGTLSAFKRVPISYQASLASFIRSNAYELDLVNPRLAPPGNADDLAPYFSLQLDPSESLVLGEQLLRAFGYAFDERALIDLGAFVITRAPFVTREVWDKISQGLTKYDLYIALAATLGRLSYTFFSDTLEGSASSWFFVSRKGKIRIGWYGRYWDLGYQQAPGGKAGLTLALGRTRTSAGVWYDFDRSTPDGQFGLEGSFSERLLSRLTEPLGWMIQTSLSANHILAYEPYSMTSASVMDAAAAGTIPEVVESANRSHQSKVTATFSARKLDPEDPRQQIVLRISGSANTVGDIQAGMSGTFAGRKLVVVPSFYATRPKSLSSATTVNGTVMVRNPKKVDGIDFSLGSYNFETVSGTVVSSRTAISARIENKRTGVKGSLTGTFSPPNSVTTKASYSVKAGVSGGGVLALRRVSDRISLMELKMDEDLASIDGRVRAIQDLSQRILKGARHDTSDVRSAYIELGSQRLLLLIHYLDHRKSVLLYNSRKSSRDPVLGRIPSDKLKRIEFELGEPTFGAENTRLAPG